MARLHEPTEVLKLRGSWRANSRGKEPKPEKGEPLMPDSLSDDAQLVWKDVVPLLEKMNVLTVVDSHALQILCETYCRWKDAEEKIRTHGTVFPIKNDDGSVKYLQQSPFVGQANQAAKLLQSLLREFGMTPSARASIHVNTGTIEETNAKRFFRNA